MDIQHFEIIVNAMLAWSDEAKAPKKTLGRHVAVAAPRAARDELDDDEEAELLDDDDFEPEEDLNIKPDTSDALDDDQPAEAEAELSAAEEDD